MSLGFFLAFPVALLLVVGNWKAARYTPDQLHLLYEGLWKEKLVFTGGAITIVAAIMNSINGFSYVYSRKRWILSQPSGKAFPDVLESCIHGAFILSCSLYDHGVFAVCIGAAKGFFSLKLMELAARLLLVHLLLYFLFYFSIVLVFV